MSLLQLLSPENQTPMYPVSREVPATGTESSLGNFKIQSKSGPWTPVFLRWPEPDEWHAHTCYRARELEWRRTHTNELRRHSGQWVVLEGEQIISSGGDLIEVVRQARETGVRVPYVFYVEPFDDDIVRIGL